MIWLNLLIFAAIIAGHTEVQVMLMNRLHSQRVQRNVLRHLEHLHEVFILVFPVWLVWFAGFRGPGLLVGGDWRGLGGGWTILFAICGLGFLSLVRGAVRWQMRRNPEQLLNQQSKVLDVADRLGDRPAGSGFVGLLARLPGNDVFRVEFAEKEFQLPSLPAAWDGMTILQLTDWHLFGAPGRRFYEEVASEAEQLSPDLICFTGDLMDNMKCLDWLPGLLGGLKSPLGKFFILGNHDWLLDPPAIRRTMQELGWRDLGSQSATISHRGLPLLIAGTERPWMGQHPDLETGPEGAFKLLLSHTPDHFRWAQKHGVDLMLSGHNHGGQIVLPIIGPMYTPSIYGVKYSGGSWYEKGTLLHVARGLAGGHPVRFNCLPEVTMLTLRATPTCSQNAADSQEFEKSIGAESHSASTG